MGLLSNLRAKALAAVATPSDLRARLQVAEGELRPRVTEHQQVRGADGGGRFAETPLGRVLESMDEEWQRAGGLGAHREVCQARHAMDVEEAGAVVLAVSRRRLDWSVVEVRWALDLALASIGNDQYDLLDRLRLPLGAAERLDRGELPGVEGSLRRALREVARHRYLSGDERRRVERRLQLLLGDGSQAATTLPPSLLHDGDAFGPALRSELGPRLFAAGVPALLVHAATSSTPNPSNAWMKVGHQLLEDVDDGPDLVRRVLLRAMTHVETIEPRDRWSDYEEWTWLHESTARLLRGLTLILADTGRPWVTSLLSDLAVYAGAGLAGSPTAPRDIVVANAAINALSRRPDAVGTAARIGDI